METGAPQPLTTTLPTPVVKHVKAPTPVLQRVARAVVVAVACFLVSCAIIVVAFRTYGTSLNTHVYSTASASMVSLPCFCVHGACMCLHGNAVGARNAH